MLFQTSERLRIAHDARWTPGQHGKGTLGMGGMIHTWNVDPATLEPDHSAIDPWHDHAISIEPDGASTVYSTVPGTIQQVGAAFKAVHPEIDVTRQLHSGLDDWPAIPSVIPERWGKVGGESIWGEHIDEPEGGWDLWGGEPKADPLVGPCPYCQSTNTGSKIIDPAKSVDPYEREHAALKPDQYKPWISNSCKDCFATWSHPRPVAPDHLPEQFPRTMMDTEPGATTFPVEWNRQSAWTWEPPVDELPHGIAPMPEVIPLRAPPGEVKMCPSCGHTVRFTMHMCPLCGHDEEVWPMDKLADSMWDLSMIK